MPGKTYSLTELAEAAGITGRTVRYYIAQGVLQNPVSQGCNAHYTDEHLERLRFIKTHQERGVTLASIKSLLGGSQTRDAIGVQSYLRIPIQDGVFLDVRADVFQERRFLILDAVLDLAKRMKEQKS